MIWATKFHNHRIAYHEGNSESNSESTCLDCRPCNDFMFCPMADIYVDHVCSGEPIMSTLRLIDPQPMETLPEDGEVYVECTQMFTWQKIVAFADVSDIRVMYSRTPSDFHAWSYTATFEKGEG